MHKSMARLFTGGQETDAEDPEDQRFATESLELKQAIAINGQLTPDQQRNAMAHKESVDLHGKVVVGIIPNANKAAEAAAAAAEPPKRLFENQIMHDEDIQDVLYRTDPLRRQRQFNKKREAEVLSAKQPGTQMYRDARRKFQQEAIPKAWALLRDPTLRASLPSPVVHGMKWFDSLDTHFVEVQSRWRNIDFFGSTMLHWALDVRALFAPGHQFKYMKLLDTAMSAVGEFNTGMAPWPLLAGEKSVGKSYMMQCVGKMLFPGVVHDFTHMTKMALTNAENDDYRAYLMEEVSGEMIGVQSSNSTSGDKTGNSILKNFFTKKEMAVATASVQDGLRTTIYQAASKISGGIFASNEPLPDYNSPLLARYIIIMPDLLPPRDELAIQNRMDKLNDAKFEVQMKRLLLRRRLVKWYIFVTEWMICMGVLRDVNMDAYGTFDTIVRKEMDRQGFPLTEIKRKDQLKKLIRSLVVEKAVCAALFSEATLPKRRDQRTSRPLRFDETPAHLVAHLRLIEKFLCCELPEYVFGVSMCPMVFGDPLKDKVIDAARAAVFGRNTDEEGRSRASVRCTYMQVTNPAAVSNSGGYPDGVNGVVEDTVPNYDYIELVPKDADTRGDIHVVNMLRSKMLNGKGSIENIGTTLRAMALENVRCKPYTKINGQLKEDPKASVARDISIIKIVRNNDVTDKANKFGRANRYYIASHVLITHQGESSAMRKALLSLQHRYMLPARLIVNWQHIDTRTQVTAGSSSSAKVRDHTFNGYFSYLDFEPTDNVHGYVNEFAMTKHDIAEIENGIDLDVPADCKMTHQSAQAAQSSGAFVNGSIDYMAYQAHQLAIGQDSDANSDDTVDDMAYWRVFKRVLQTAREQLSNFYEKSQRTYPDDDIREVQYMNSKRDIAQYSDDSRRQEALTPLSDLMMSSAKYRPVPSAEMIESMRQHNDGEMLEAYLSRKIGVHRHATRREVVERSFEGESSERIMALFGDGDEFASGRHVLHDDSSRGSTSSFSSNSAFGLSDIDAPPEFMAAPAPPSAASRESHRRNLKRTLQTMNTESRYESSAVSYEGLEVDDIDESVVDQAQKKRRKDVECEETPITEGVETLGIVLSKEVSGWWNKTL